MNIKSCPHPTSLKSYSRTTKIKAYSKCRAAFTCINRAFLKESNCLTLLLLACFRTLAVISQETAYSCHRRQSLIQPVEKGIV
jgi:hypothetical protein